jgi:segregation and condensation protein B
MTNPADNLPAWQLDVEPPPVLEPPGDEPSAPRASDARRKPRDEGRLELRTPPPPVQILEAMLFVSSVPLTAQRAGEVIRGLTPELFEEHVSELNRRYRSQGRPYLIQRQDGGEVLTLRPVYRFVLEKLYGSVREARLSGPAVEVLAIVAYKQPLTRAEVEALRGHDSGSLLRQLVRRGLIGIVGRAESGGNEVQYGTTPRFLEVFGLSSLEELPETEDLSKL